MKTLKSLSAPLGRFLHAPIVEIDAVASHMLDRKPVAGLEVALCRACALAEERVMLVEALEQDQRDRKRLLRCGPLTDDGRCRRRDR